MGNMSIWLCLFDLQVSQHLSCTYTHYFIFTYRSCKSRKYKKQNKKRPRYCDNDAPHQMVNAPSMVDISQPMPM